jgi:hypothetical protein
MLIIGAGLVALNVAMATRLREFLVICLLLGPGLARAGAWMVVIGRPIDPYTGQPARWSRVGIAACVAAGLIASVVTLLWLVAAGYEAQLDL